MSTPFRDAVSRWTRVLAPAVAVHHSPVGSLRVPPVGVQSRRDGKWSKRFEIVAEKESYDEHAWVHSGNAMIDQGADEVDIAGTTVKMTTRPPPMVEARSEMAPDFDPVA